MEAPRLADTLTRDLETVTAFYRDAIDAAARVTQPPDLTAQLDMSLANAAAIKGARQLAALMERLEKRSPEGTTPRLRLAQ